VGAVGGERKKERARTKGLGVVQHKFVRKKKKKKIKLLTVDKKGGWEGMDRKTQGSHAL